ncbi:MAG: hypothetical protein L6R42_010679 [Xanthoria sp. 1 TBL-2021]|nr:MAG: hypothetical protein L6R42_010679 [Xanthoria sp. 1 TBL-2021]
MSSYEDFDSDEMQSQAATSFSDSDETQSQAATSSHEGSDSDSDSDSGSDSDSDEVDVPRLTAEEKKATTEGKDPKPFTSLIKYPTLLIKSIPILENPVYVCRPDWEQKCDVVHKSLVSVNALQGSCDDLRSTLEDRLKILKSFTGPSTEKAPTEQKTMTATFANNISDVLAKITQANGKLIDLESRLRWKQVRVVTSYCTSCDETYGRDWTDLHGHFDHPPAVRQCCFGNGWLRKEQSMLEGLNLN